MVATTWRDHLAAALRPPRRPTRRAGWPGAPSRRSGLHGAGELLHRAGGLLQVAGGLLGAAATGPGCRWRSRSTGGADAVGRRCAPGRPALRSESCIVRSARSSRAGLVAAVDVDALRQVAGGDGLRPRARASSIGRAIEREFSSVSGTTHDQRHGQHASEGRAASRCIAGVELGRRAPAASASMHLGDLGERCSTARMCALALPSMLVGDAWRCRRRRSASARAPAGRRLA